MADQVPLDANPRPPLVSVIIPAFNAANTIAETIESLRRQTHSNIEVIVCDDASTDATAAIVSGISAPPTRLLSNTSNLGPGPSRDLAISVAQGEWLAFVDADDTCHPQRIERLLAATAGDRNVIAFDNCIECHDTDAGLQPWRVIRRPDAFGSPNDRGFVDLTVGDWVRSPRMLMQPLLSTQEVRVRGVLHSDLRFAEDSEFVLRLLSTGMTLRFLPEALYNYRITPGSLTASRRRWSGSLEMFQSVLPLFAGNTEATQALQQAIVKTRRMDRYQQLVADLKAGRFAAGIWSVACNPRLALVLASRVLQDLGYKAHLKRSGGKAR